MDGYPEHPEHLEPLLRELIGAELRAARQGQRRTLAQVAAQAGVSMQHLSDVERGRKDPSSELLAAIAGALGTTVPRLLARIASATMLELTSTSETAPAPARLRELSGGRRTSASVQAGLTLLAAA